MNRVTDGWRVVRRRSTLVAIHFATTSKIAMACVLTHSVLSGFRSRYPLTFRSFARVLDVPTRQLEVFSDVVPVRLPSGDNLPRTYLSEKTSKRSSHTPSGEHFEPRALLSPGRPHPRQPCPSAPKNASFADLRLVGRACTVGRPADSRRASPRQADDATRPWSRPREYASARLCERSTRDCPRPSSLRPAPRATRLTARVLSACESRTSRAVVRVLLRLTRRTRA